MSWRVSRIIVSSHMKWYFPANNSVWVSMLASYILQMWEEQRGTRALHLGGESAWQEIISELDKKITKKHLENMATGNFIYTEKQNVPKGTWSGWHSGFLARYNFLADGLHGEVMKAATWRHNHKRSEAGERHAGGFKSVPLDGRASPETSRCCSEEHADVLLSSIDSMNSLWAAPGPLPIGHWQGTISFSFLFKSPRNTWGMRCYLRSFCL